MILNDVPKIFNRALLLTFNKKKNLLVFLILLLCGVLVVFFRGLSVNAGRWVLLSLTFLPIFLCAGVLLATGIFIIRVYHDEVKKKEISYNKILSKSWEVILGATYFSIPIILIYLMLWMLLGIFVMLSTVPGIGKFFSVILAFGPFLINLGSIALIVLNIAMLFFVAPILALKGLNRIQISQLLSKRFEKDVFSNLYLFFISVLPLLAVVGILIGAAFLTGSLYEDPGTPVQTVLMWFFTMIPFTAILTPAIVFFFNFAAEAHVLTARAPI